MTDMPRGRLAGPARGAGLILLAAVLLLAGCVQQVRTSASASLPASPSVDEAALERAAIAATAYGEKHPDAFAGVYLDVLHPGRVIVRFTVDLDRHQDALDRLAGRGGLYLVQRATWSLTSLSAVQQALDDARGALDQEGITLTELGPDFRHNVLEVSAISERPDALDVIEGYGPPGAVAVKLQTWTNESAGVGWRLLGSFSGTHLSGVAVAADDEQLSAELDHHRIMVRSLSWAPSREVVAFFGYTVGSSCPEVRIDGVKIDLAQRLVYGEYSDPIGPRVCTADRHGSVTFLVALERSALPESPFRLRLERELPPCSPTCAPDVPEVVVDLR